MTTPQITSLYRRLLRELPTSAPTTRTAHQKLSTPSVLQRRIRNSLSTETANPTAQLQQAEQFVQYVQAQRMYATLIERYNPGMGMSEEERVRLTARRVGMDLPDEFGR
jgi:ATP synthase assembly factor FMC1